jgi:sterol desaturase/sphingolipid hydroxylase (fatty acid hydroxylase superfamily)
MDVSYINTFNRFDKLNNINIHSLYKNNIYIVLRNQIIIDTPSMCILSFIPNNQSIISNTINFILAMLFNIIIYSASHHFMHKYYYNIHKLHHKNKHLISINSEYNSLSEHFISWFIATWLPLYIFNMNHYLNIIYIFLNTIYGVIGHSNYNIPYLSTDIKRHTEHHKKVNVNFSGIAFYDHFMNSNYI